MTFNPRVAFHESGHACSAVLVGLGVEEVSVEPRGRLLGYNAYGSGPCNLEGRVMVAYAGGHAEQRYCGQTVGRFQGNALDYSQAAELMRAVGGENRLRFQAYCEKESRQLVKRHWPQIQEVAAELLAVGTLDGQRVVDLMNATRHLVGI